MARPRRSPARKTSGRQHRLTAEERRESILDAASGVFAARGYEAAAIDDIAAAGGVSKALIYEHFPGKKELFAEIMRTGTARVLRRVGEAAAPGRGAAERLERGVDAFLSFVADYPDTWRVVMQDVPDPEIMALDKTLLRQAVSGIAGLVEADPSVAALEVTRAEVEQIAVMVMGAVTHISWWWMEHPSAQREDLVANMMSVIWLGLDRLRRGERYGETSAEQGKIEPEGK